MTMFATPKEWENLQRLFEMALEQLPEKRSAFLEQACGGDGKLQAQVQALLMANQESEGLLDHPLIRPTIQPRDMFGKRIGPYRIENSLGEGGMGEVYLAERDDGEFFKQVAIKVLRVGPGYKLLAGRFESERQILAQLEHPNIVRLLDGGRTEEGHLYLVMEYVDGLPIDQHCNQRGLNVADRLELFLRVCEAVEHAHRNLVVHRDLKPANILVTDEGQSKLLDFGIARLLAPDIFHRPSEPTVTLLRAATPRYASPEQIKGGVITTASDVYSLGVLLYELLSGHSPYREPKGLSHEVARAVLEEEPEKPSRAIFKTEKVDTNFIPRSFQRYLEGDLDNIILKALNKDPAQRYPSVEAFSRDIRHHLEGRPVSARTPTWGYLMATFIRRYPWRISAAVAAVAVLIGGATVFAWQAQIAERRFNQVRKLANSLVFKIDPALQKIPGATTIRMVLVKEALEYLDALVQDSSNDPRLEDEMASAYEHLGNVQGNYAYSNLGQVQSALASYRSALAIRRRLVSETPTDALLKERLATSLRGYGKLLRLSGQTAQALQTYNKALSIRKQLSSAKPTSFDLLSQLSQVYEDIGTLLFNAGDGDVNGAEKNFRMELAVVQQQIQLKPENETVFVNNWYVSRNLGLVALARHKPNEALLKYNECLKIMKKLSSTYPNNIKYKYFLSIDYLDIGDALGKPQSSNLGDWQGALNSYKQALSIDSYLVTMDAKNIEYQRELSLDKFRIAEILLSRKRPNEALKYYIDMLEIRTKLLNIDKANVFANSDLAFSYQGIGSTFMELNDVNNAVKNYKQALELRRWVALKDPSDKENQRWMAETLYSLGKSFKRSAESRNIRDGKLITFWKQSRDYYRQAIHILSNQNLSLTLNTPAVQLFVNASREFDHCNKVIQSLTERM